MKTIRVKVKPSARVSELEGPDASGVWRARLKSPPVDGKANAELVELLAKQFACRRCDVVIKGGASGRIKRVEIAD